MLGLGCWSFGGGEYWGPTNQRDVERVVRRAVDLGVNYFDTAEVYNQGRSEESLGQALRGVPRERVVIGTKIAPGNTRRETLPRRCEASLRRLKTDYIDLYMIHWPIRPHSIAHFTDDPEVIAHPPAVREAWEALERLRERGLVRHVGVSNFGVSCLQELEAFALPVTANQLPYNLLSRAIEFETLGYCREHGIGVVGYMTLLQGVLGDRYGSLAEVPPWQRRTRHFSCRGNELCRHGEPGAEPQMEEALRRVRAIAAEAGTSTAALALRWATAVPGISCCLIGTRSVERLEENAAAVAEPLAEELARRLEAATEAVKRTLGPSLDYYESVANDRTR